MAKANIPNASFPTILTTSLYERRQNVTVGRNKELTLNIAMSIIGGVVDDQFGESFNVATIGGLYDRVLFGEAVSGFHWVYRQYPLPASNMPLDPAPIAVRTDGSVTEVGKAWRKKHDDLDRIVEVCIRIAKTYASLDVDPLSLAWTWKPYMGSPCARERLGRFVSLIPA